MTTLSNLMALEAVEEWHNSNLDYFSKAVSQNHIYKIGSKSICSFINSKVGSPTYISRNHEAQSELISESVSIKNLQCSDSI